MAADFTLTGDVEVQGLDKLRAEAERVQHSMQPLQKSLEGVQTAAAGATKVSNEMAASMARTSQATQQTKESITQTRGAVSDFGASLAGTNVALGQTKQSITQTREALGSLGSSFAGTSLALGGARAALVAFANPLTFAVAGVAGLAIGAAVAAERVANLQNMFLDTARSVEELGGSFRLITDLARDTGKSAEQLGQRYLQLIQQGRALGLNQEQINRNFEIFERAVVRFRVPTIAEAARGAKDAFLDMLAGFDRLLGVSQIIVGLFNTIRDVIQIIARWLPEQTTATQRLTAEQQRYDQAVARLQATIERIRRGEQETGEILRDRMRGRDTELSRLQAIARIQEQINNLQRPFRTEVFPAFTPEQLNIIDGVTGSISRAMQHWLQIGNLLQHQQEVRNQMYQIELQLIQAGVAAADARRIAGQFGGQLAITQAAQQFQSIRQSLLSQEQLELESHQRRIMQLMQFGEARADMAAQVNALIEAETYRHTFALQQIEMQRNQIMFNALMGTAQHAQELFQVLGQKSKAFAIAAIVVGKGLAIATTIQQGIAASMAALAPPPIGLGPVAGIPLAAAIRALTAVNVGLIAATGIGQIAGLGGGGLSSGGGGDNTPPAQDTDMGPVRRIVIEHVDDAVFFTGKQLNALIDQINSEAENGRVVVASKLIP